MLKLFLVGEVDNNQVEAKHVIELQDSDTELDVAQPKAIHLGKYCFEH